MKEEFPGQQAERAYKQVKEELEKHQIRFEYPELGDFHEIDRELFDENAQKAVEIVEAIEEVFSYPFIYDDFYQRCPDFKTADEERRVWKRDLQNNERFGSKAGREAHARLQQNLFRVNVLWSLSINLSTLASLLDKAGNKQLAAEIKQSSKEASKIMDGYEELSNEKKRERILRYFEQVQAMLCLLTKDE